MRKHGKTVTHLHCRSHYSLLNGIMSPAVICRSAAQAGESSAAITDVNNLYALPEFIEAAATSGIKPVCGAAVALPQENGKGGSHLFTAYCRDRKGFARLNSIISKINYSYSQYTERKFYDPVSDLLENGRDGLVVVSNRYEVIMRLIAAGNEDLYYGLYYGTPFRDAVIRARKHGIKTAALNEAVFSDDSDRSALAVLRAVGNKSTIEKTSAGSDWASACGAMAPSANILAGAERMDSFFSSVPEALANSRRIADETAGAAILPDKWIFPLYRGMHEEEAGRELYRLCRAALPVRYPEEQRPGAPLSVGRPPFSQRAAALQRLEYEMGIICRKGFAGYFLVVRDIVMRAPRTCGRGSAASSIVSYLLGITHVDPLRYNLFFERFLNMDRNDPPDIDVDFPWDEREKALNYVFEHYSGSSAMVCDHVFFKRRGAAREAARAHGMDEARVNALMKNWRGGRGEPLPDYVAETAAMLYRQPRYIGTHPGGVVITPGPITNYTHIQPSASGYPVIAWEKDGAESSGLIKIDILGNRSLAVLRDTIRLVNPGRENKIEWASFQPYSDQRTRRYIESGDTAGIFYIESPATRQLLKKMGRADFEHLVAASSIIRPAANKWINEYVRRLKGGAYNPLHPLLAGILDETYGIMVYQEDVAKVAIAAAGFSPGEADQLRKILSKKNRAEKLPAWRTRFTEGAASRGVPASEADELWAGILSFDGYSFCKSHSASYALVSYRLAWLKLRYPLEFMISVINNGGGFYSRQVYLNIVRRMGFPVMIPDINRSQRKYSIEKTETGEALRAGLLQIRDLSGDFIDKLLAERTSRGDFRSFNDFTTRTGPSYRDIRMLIKSGSLDSIAGELNRPQMFWLFYSGNCSGGFFGRQLVPGLKAYSRRVCLSDEIDTLSLFFSEHPIDVFSDRIKRSSPHPLIDSRAIGGHMGMRVSIAGTLAAEKEALTSDKKPMCFISFEDPFSMFETVFFPDAWKAYEAVISSGFAFIVSGVVDNDLGAEYIRVTDLRCLNRIREAV